MSGPIAHFDPAAFDTWHPPQPAVLKTAAPAAGLAPAGITAGPVCAGAAARAFCAYSQIALVYQTPISTAKSSPPASGSTGFGKRCSRTIVIFEAYAPKKAQPS